MIVFVVGGRGTYEEVRRKVGYLFVYYYLEFQCILIMEGIPGSHGNVDVDVGLRYGWLYLEVRTIF